MSEDKAPIFDYYWRILAGDMPRPVPEFEFDKVIKRKHRFDWAFPEYRVAVEVDGGQWSKGGGRHAGDDDREKTNIAASLRWLVFHFSPDQLKRDPKNCVRLVVQAIKDSQ
jgi:very-short-patch-repair endonuclease